MAKSITTTSTVQDGSDPTEPEPAARLHARVNPSQHDDGFTLHTRITLLHTTIVSLRPDHDRRGFQSDGSYDRRCHWGSDPRATWHASHPTGTAHLPAQLMKLPAAGAHCAPVAGGSWRLTDHVELARPTRTHILDCTCRLKPHRVAIDHRRAAARLFRADDHAAGGEVEAAGLLAREQAA